MILKLLTVCALAVAMVMSSNTKDNFGNSKMMAAIKDVSKSVICPAELKTSKDLGIVPSSGFSAAHLELDLYKIKNELINERTYINDLQAYTVEPPTQALCDHIRYNTSIYNGKINYIAGLCNVDISVRKQQYYALESAKRHVWRAEEKFDKYFSVLKSQIPKQDSIKGTQIQEEKKFIDISHPLMAESNHNSDDVISQELNRLWDSGQSIMKAVETENIMELTTILLKEIVHTFELIFSPSIKTSDTSPDISYIMSTGSMNTHVIELSNNASLLNVFITDLLPILDLGRSNLDEDIVSPTNLECIVENKNYKLESQGYKVGTLPEDYFKPNEIKMVRSLSKDAKHLVLSLIFKVVKKSVPLVPSELIDIVEDRTYDYLNEGGQYAIIVLVIIGLVILAIYLRKLCKRVETKEDNDFLVNQSELLNMKKAKNSKQPSAPLLLPV